MKGLESRWGENIWRRVRYATMGRFFFLFPGVVKIEDAGGVGEVLMVFGREREGEEEMERPRRDYEDEERDKADYE